MYVLQKYNIIYEEDNFYIYICMYVSYKYNISKYA